MRLIKTSASKGFSLIELLVVIAIIGVLTALALPGYQDYRIKVEIDHAVAALYAQSVDVEAVYLEEGQFPVSIPLVPLSGSENAQIKWWTRGDRQAIHIEVWLGEKIYDGANGMTMLLLEGIPDTFGRIGWECVEHANGSFRVDEQYLPEECANPQQGGF